MVLAGYDTTAPTPTTWTWASPPTTSTTARSPSLAPWPGSGWGPCCCGAGESVKEQDLATQGQGMAPRSMGNVYGRGTLGEFKSGSTDPGLASSGDRRPPESGLTAFADVSGCNGLGLWDACPYALRFPVTNGIDGQASHKPPGRKPRDVPEGLKLPKGLWGFGGFEGLRSRPNGAIRCCRRGIVS